MDYPVGWRSLRVLNVTGSPEAARQTGTATGGPLEPLALELGGQPESAGRRIRTGPVLSADPAATTEATVNYSLAAWVIGGSQRGDVRGGRQHRRAGIRAPVPSGTGAGFQERAGTPGRLHAHEVDTGEFPFLQDRHPGLEAS